MASIYIEPILRVATILLAQGTLLLFSRPFLTIYYQGGNILKVVRFYFRPTYISPLVVAIIYIAIGLSCSKLITFEVARQCFMHLPIAWDLHRQRTFVD